MSFLSSSQSNIQSQSLQLARVEDPIIPKYDGRVFFEGTYWNARFYDPDCSITVFPGERVHVIARESLTLLVMPVDFNAPSTSYKMEN